MASPSTGNPFDDFLRRRWSELGMTQADFAKAVGEDDARISAIRRYHETGKRPPLDKLDLWVSALKLDGKDREYFVYLANIAHANRYLHDLIIRLEAEMALETKQIRDATVTINAQSKEIAELKALAEQLRKRFAEIEGRQR